MVWRDACLLICFNSCKLKGNSLFPVWSGLPEKMHFLPENKKEISHQWWKSPNSYSFVIRNDCSKSPSALCVNLWGCSDPRVRTVLTIPLPWFYEVLSQPSSSFPAPLLSDTRQSSLCSREGMTLLATWYTITEMEKCSYGFGNVSSVNRTLFYATMLCHKGVHGIS